MRRRLLDENARARTWNVRLEEVMRNRNRARSPFFLKPSSVNRRYDSSTDDASLEPSPRKRLPPPHLGSTPMSPGSVVSGP